MHARHHARGWVPDGEHDVAPFHPRPAEHVVLPVHKDLRGKLPAAWNQGAIQSCTAHALGAALWVLRPGVMVSRLALYWLARRERGTLPFDSGAMLRHAVAGLMQSGVVGEAQWRYRPVPGRGAQARFGHRAPPVLPPPAGHPAAVVPFRLAQEARALKSCLADGYPVAFGFYAHASFRDRNGRWRRVMPVPRAGEAVLGGHAVAAVGYDDRRQALLIRNSWGAGVQEGGHFWMPYAAALDPAVATDFWTLRRR